MKRLLLVSLLLAGFGYRSAAQVSVITFDDLWTGGDFDITGSDYGGVYWEQGNAGFQGYTGGWVTGYNGSGAICYSPQNNIVNRWCSTLTGIAFPSVVDVEGAYFAIAATSGTSTTGVRVHGFLNGSEIETTGWFNQIGRTPVWFNMNLNGVDRIVIESVPTVLGAGWYGMDNFTYTVVPEPGVTTLTILGSILLLRRERGGRRAA